MVEKYRVYSGIFFVTFWIVATYLFVFQMITPFMMPYASIVLLFTDSVWLIMGLLTMRNRGDILIMFAFIALAIAALFAYHDQTLFTLSNGLRAYFGLVFALPILRYFTSGENGARFMRSFDKALYVFLWIQVPCIAWQFLKYGAGDHVGGSLGDWSSGTISTLIYAISFYLITKKFDPQNYFSSLWENKKYIFLLLPTFFNETKISFIFLILYFILLMRINFGMVKRILLMSPIIVILFLGLGYIYLSVTDQKADEVLSEEFFQIYFIGEDFDTAIDIGIAVQDEGFDYEGDWGAGYDLPRFTKIFVVHRILDESHISQWIGAGPGQFKGTQVIGKSKFARVNKWMLSGTRPWLFYIWVDTGYLGIILNIIVMLRMIAFRKNKLAYGVNIKLYITVMFLAMFVYSEFFNRFEFVLILAYILMRTYKTLPGDKTVVSEEDEEEDTESDSQAFPLNRHSI
ncbi:MAG: hypothetical protein NC098_03830 [Lachnoclostridium sp.]|nr:hypothetical protein [Lachnoclostridium sp.]